MKAATFTYTNPGGHNPNEDMVGFKGDENNYIWGLADGLGGHSSGEMASKLAVNTMLSLDIVNNVVSSKIIESVYDSINEAVQIQKGPRTTLVTAWMKNNSLLYANVGDSRFYYFRYGELIQRTVDHSVGYSAYLSRELSYENIRFHPDRSHLTRALGIGEKSGVQTYPLISVASGDAFLMCSDGFWENVFETEMEIDLIKSRTPKEWMNFMLLRIVRRLKSDGDNLSAIAVIFQ